MKGLRDCFLYTFVDTAYLNSRTPVDVTKALCDGGSDIIQLRAKHSGRSEIRSMAEAVVNVTQRAGVPLVINDYPEIAAEIGAEVVHLGQEDFFDTGYNQRTDVTDLSPKTLLGLSSHAPEQALRAIAAGADYIAVGPVFATGTKPGRTPVTLEYVRWAAENVRVPWFAIGGISLKTLDEVIAAGAQRVCVVSAILNAPDIAKACQEFKRRLKG